MKLETLHSVEDGTDTREMEQVQLGTGLLRLVRITKCYVIRKRAKANYYLHVLHHRHSKDNLEEISLKSFHKYVHQKRSWKTKKLLRNKKVLWNGLCWVCGWVLMRKNKNKYWVLSIKITVSCQGVFSEHSSILPRSIFNSHQQSTTWKISEDLKDSIRNVLYVGDYF